MRAAGQWLRILKIREQDMLKMISSLVLLFMMMLSCSSNTESMALFQGDPGIHHLPANLEIQQIMGKAPPTKFSTLKYENHVHDYRSGRERHIYTSIVNLKEQDKHIAVTKTEYFIIQPDGSESKQVTEVDVGVPGIISFIYLTTKHQPPQHIQFKKLVKRFDNVNGRLFPLEKRSKFSVNIIYVCQTTRGSANSPDQELSWSYKFKIIESYDGYSLPGRTLPGKVYVIEKHEIDPDGMVDVALIHFAETPGVVVKTVRQVDNIIEETRLIDMEK